MRAAAVRAPSSEKSMALKVITSKHLRTSTELTLVAPIQRGFVPTETHDLMSYGTRLGALLKTFFELRRAATELSLYTSVGPLERLRSLYNFSWSVFDGGSKLLLAVTFDRPWEPYIRAIVDQAGPLLDAIFCHCEGYAGSSTEDGYVQFASWVRERQIDVSLFYAAEPDLTVDDQRYLKELERIHRERAAGPVFDERAARLALGEPGLDGIPPGPARPSTPEEARALQGVLDQRLARSLGAVLALQPFFHVPAGASRAAQDQRRFFERAAWLLVSPNIVGDLDAVAARLPGGLGAALVALSVAASRLRGEPRAAGVKLAAPEPAPEPSVGDRPEAQAGERPELSAQVQGNILTPYPHMTHGCLVLIGFDSGEAGRAFLQRLAPQVTLDSSVSDTTEIGVNVALSFEGLRTLGLTEHELEQFPREFREGMAARAGLLGDVAEEHPELWQEPRCTGLEREGQGAVLPLSSVDLMLVVQRNMNQTMDASWNEAHPAWERVHELVKPGGQSLPGVRVLHVQTLQREFTERAPDVLDAPKGRLVKERFGFADGVSQPVPACRAKGTDAKRDGVALGELLLGHPNDRGGGDRYPGHDVPLCRDGSFMVVRKLEQDVGALELFINENASQFRGGAEELYAKLMGRYRDGRSPASAGKLNDFDYAGELGDKCPLVSHVRRANPRTPEARSVHGLAIRVPRLLRRGFSYGPLSKTPSKEPRGLMFMAYNASLAEQFEVVQRWLNGGNSTGALSSHADPLLSHRSGQMLTLLDGQEPRHLRKDKPFVKLKWGMYLFAPSAAALATLASPERALRDSAAAQERARAAIGATIIAKLKAAEAAEKMELGGAPGEQLSLPRSLYQWKLLLEDRGARDEARAVWAAIRQQHQGVLRTPYGVLVGAAEHVEAVLRDEQHFSVRPYWQRMQDSVGPLYLGMDRCPVVHASTPACPHQQKPESGGARHAAPPAAKPVDPKWIEYEAAVDGSSYSKAATEPNRYMYALTRRGAFEAALAVSQKTFDELLPYVDLTELAKRVVSQVSRQWFGLPLDRAGYDTFHTAALSIFYPHPESEVRAAAAQLGQALVEAKRAAHVAAPPLAVELAKLKLGAEQVQAALVGGAQGTLAATVGSFVSVANHCLENGRLGRLRQWLESAPGQAWRAQRAGWPSHGQGPHELEEPLIVQEILKAMGRQPAPDLLHRVAVAETKLGGVQVLAGDTLVVSVGSAIVSEQIGAGRWSPDLLFGGSYSAPRGAPLQTQHACPGKEAALGMILGMLVALLDKDVRREGPLRVALRKPL